MKKFVSLILFLLFLFSSAFAESWRIFDNANLFSKDEIEELENKILSLQKDTNIDFVVLTTDDYLGLNNQQFIAETFYDSGSFGFGRSASGLIYYIDMNQHYHYVSTSGKMISLFENYTHSSLEDCALYMKTGEYKESVSKMLDWAMKAIHEAQTTVKP